IDAALRSMVSYRELNLLKDLSTIGQCDVVFCRNVLIYFDQDTKSRVLDAIVRLLPKDGFLFLGGAETVLGVSDKFAPAAGLSGIYCPSTPGATAASAATATALRPTPAPKATM